MTETDRDMARGLLRLLWQRYDTGGESHGRSREAALLEAAMGLMGPCSADVCKMGDENETKFLADAQGILRNARRASPCADGKIDQQMLREMGGKLRGKNAWWFGPVRVFLLRDLTWDVSFETPSGRLIRLIPDASAEQLKYLFAALG